MFSVSVLFFFFFAFSAIIGYIMYVDEIMPQTAARNKPRKFTRRRGPMLRYPPIIVMRKLTGHFDFNSVYAVG